jgi:hypothetical protein
VQRSFQLAEDEEYCTVDIELLASSVDFYSCRKAAIGSTLAALRAGM